MLSTRNDEKDSLREQVEQVKSDLISVENELENALRRLERRDGKRIDDGGIGEMSRAELERVRFRNAPLSILLLQQSAYSICFSVGARHLPR